MVPRPGLREVPISAAADTTKPITAAGTRARQTEPEDHKTRTASAPLTNIMTHSATHGNAANTPIALSDR